MNKQRAETARQALYQHCQSKGEPLDTLETGIIDLMTDLMHLARQEGLPSPMLREIAWHHFLEEVDEEIGA